MKDQNKTKAQLIDELKEMRQRVSELERSEVERKRTGEVLRESVNLFNRVPVALYRTATDGEIMDFNPALLDLLGFPDRETAVASDISNVYVNLEERVQWRSLVEREGILRDFEVQLRRSDGRIIWVNDTARVVRDTAGETLYYEGSLEDISARKMTEQSLQESEERYKRLVNNAPDIIYRFRMNPEPGFEFISATVHSITGYTPDDFYQNPAFGLEIIHEDDRKGLEDFLKGEVAERSQIVHWLHKNGDIIWIEDRQEPYFEDGHLIGVEGIARDVTERVQAEEALRKVKDQLQISVEYMPNAYILWDLDLKAVEWNKGAEKIFGYSKEEILGKNPANYIVPEDVRDIVGDVLKQLKVGEVASYSEKDNNIRKDGQMISCHWFNTPLADEDGNVFGILTLAQDITERKNAEEEILLLNKELEQRVLERTEEIESFSYSVSHDLRAPLRAINGYSEILMSDYADALDDEVQGYLNRIHTASQEMHDLITDMLSLSRLSRKKLTLTSFKPDEIALQAFETLKAMESEREINFHTLPCPQIIADQNLIKLLLSNLISNGIKFTRGEQPVVIEFGSMAEERHTVFYLRDNGIGFDMAYADKLFAPFQRLHSGDEFEGSGIGLAIAHRVIQNHKGKIWVESEKEEGTTIYFTIGSLIDKQ